MGPPKFREPEKDTPFDVRFQTGNEPSENARDILVSQLNVRISGKQLFSETDCKISSGHRYGLMGPNGRGKTTLLKLIEERHLPVPANLNVQLVAQEQEAEAMDSTAVEVVLSTDTRRTSLMAESERLINEDGDPDRIGEIEDELESISAFTAEGRARKILIGLGFPQDWLERPTRSFSGGWRKRITLACAIFMEPDVLLLDEPTNHLDLNAVIWLDNYLPKIYNSEKKGGKSLVIVSHDVSFLDSVCTDMIHIDKFKLNYYRGNYEKFCSQLVSKKSEDKKKYEKQQKEIKEWKKKGVTKGEIEERLKKDALKQGRGMDEAQLTKSRDYQVTFPFPDPPELRDPFITKMDSVWFRYNEQLPWLFKNTNFGIFNKSRIALVGPNGVGKTTLLNLMCGILDPVEGTVEVNRQVRIGKFSQHFVDQLPLDVNPCVYLEQLGLATETDQRCRLGSFGLEGTSHKTLVGNLSGGQKARVAFAGISVSKPHVLLFDEPTNHLDLESIEALATRLKDFEGGVLIISHDQRLLDSFVEEIWVVRDQSVSKFDGDFDDYREEVLEEIEERERQMEAEEAEKEARREAERKKKKALKDQAAGKASGKVKGKKGAPKGGQEPKEEAEEAKEEAAAPEKPAPKPKAKGKKGKKNKGDDLFDDDKADAVAKKAMGGAGGGDAPEQPSGKAKLGKLFAKKK